MFWSSILLVYVLQMRSEGELYDIQKTFLLECKFWYSNQVQFKTNKGYLFKIGVDVECKSDDNKKYVYYPKRCYSLTSTNLGYFVLENLIIKAINTVLKSSKNTVFFLKFSFFFTDKLINNHCDYRSYKGKIKKYVSYKLLEKKSDNVANLRCDSKEIRSEHIKDVFKGLVCLKLLKFNEYTKNVNLKKIIKTGNGLEFNLYFFENYSECCENLKGFIKELCYFNLLEDDFFNEKFAKIFLDKVNILKVSRFRKWLSRKFYMNIKKQNCFGTDKECEFFFDKCYDFIINEIQNNNIFFQIGGNYTINYYIEQLLNLISETVEEIRRDYGRNIFGNDDFIISEITDSLKFGLNKLQIKTVQGLYGFEFVNKYFSDIFGRKIETLDDYIEVEKIMCDYYNMFVTIFNLQCRFNKENSYSLYSYVLPILIDDYFDLKIIDGIEIKFNDSVQFEKIRGFDDKGKGVIMVKDIDYFIDESGVLCCPSEVFKLKNIYKIELILYDKDNSMRFKVSEYIYKI